MQQRPARSIVPYLKGKGGDQTRSPDETKAATRALFASIRSKLDALENEALAIEASMEDISTALKLSQPQGMYREMSLRWWKTSAHSAREPVLCRLESAGKNGRLKVVTAKKGMTLRKDRSFAIGADIAASTINHYWQLKAIRDELLSIAKNLNASVPKGQQRRIRLIEKITSDTEKHISEMKKRIKITMLNHDDETNE